MSEEPVARCQELGLWKFDDVSRDVGNPSLKAIVMLMELVFQLKDSSGTQAY